MTDEKIYQRMFVALLEQQLAPNKKINEEELASVFGVSRTIIRKVLLRLSLDGAIVLHKNRGAYVASPSAEQVNKLYAARRIVEHGIVGIACEVAGKKDIRNLRELISSEQRCHVNGDRSGRIRLSGEFHLEIARISGNEQLYGFLRQLVVQTSLARAAFEQKGVSPCSTTDHEQLVAAIDAGNVDAARTFMMSHLKSSEAELKLLAPSTKGDLKSILS